MACFEHKLIKNHFKLISYSTMFTKHWAWLHEGKDAEDIRTGADGLMRLAGVTIALGGNSATTDGRRPLRLKDVVREEESAGRIEKR
jgi:hypothetical protein